MTLIPTEEQHKRILLKAYMKQWQLEKVLEIISNRPTAGIQLSLLGKFNEYCTKENYSLEDKERKVEDYWRHIWGGMADFGFFSNVEIGTIFTMGPLTGTFLHDVEGSKLAELYAAPYGIFRGFGVPEDQAAGYINILANGGYLLILRGYDQELKLLEDSLVMFHS